MCLGLLFASSAAAQPKETKVAAPTRLDWAFAAQGFGKDAAKLPASFDSTKQRYQLYVPKSYDRTKAWPLVLFISPGDQPAGWSNWKGVCEKEGVFFCSPYAAGNSVAAGPRTRIILDALDDVRRHYAIDPDQTYISGFSGGGRMACAIGFALPELFGGVVPVCGTNPPPALDYLRHRLQDRLSVALVTGETDFNRKENEEYMGPWLKDLDVRAKVWVAPKVGHAVPGEKILAEVYAWLKEDLPRRQTERKDRPKLALTAEEAPAGNEQAKRLVEAAEAELQKRERIWRGIALLQGVTKRWPKSAAAGQARQLLQKASNDQGLLGPITEQAVRDEIQSLTAQAKAFERFGLINQAIQAWTILAQNYADAPIGQDAQKHIERLRAKKK